MKKSNTLFTLAFFAILAFSSCEREQWGNAQKGPDDIDNRAEGQIGLYNPQNHLAADNKTTCFIFPLKQKTKRLKKRSKQHTKSVIQMLFKSH